MLPTIRQYVHPIYTQCRVREFVDNSTEYGTCPVCGVIVLGDTQ